MRGARRRFAGELRAPPPPPRRAEAALRCAALCDGGAEPRGSRFVSFHFSLGKFLIPPPAAVPAVPPPLGAPPRPHSASAERSAERRPLRAVGAVLCPLLCAPRCCWGCGPAAPPPHPHPLLGPGAAVQCWMSHTAPIPHHCIPPPSPPVTVWVLGTAAASERFRAAHLRCI